MAFNDSEETSGGHRSWGLGILTLVIFLIVAVDLFTGGALAASTVKEVFQICTEALGFN